ncbi:MAG: hypothetical protein ACYDAG_02625, partial [Chloroflexota bacterium]
MTSAQERVGLTRRQFVARGLLAAGAGLAGSSLLGACGLVAGSQKSGGVQQLAKVDKITFLTPPWGVPPKADALKAFEKK